MHQPMESIIPTSPHYSTAVGRKKQKTTINTLVPEDLSFKPSHVHHAGTLLSLQYRETDSIITFQLGTQTKQAKIWHFPLSTQLMQAMKTK